MAHRLAWRLVHGPIPNGMKVLHRCDVPPCVNPRHLWLGTQQDNVRDMMDKGRHRAYARDGEKNPRARLRLEQVTEIRRRRQEGEKLRVLAADYGVSMTQISLIARMRSWV